MKQKQLGIVLLVLVVEISTMFIFSTGLLHDKNTSSKPFTSQIDKSSMFAIMLEQNKDNEDYVESVTSTWPTSGYTYNSSRSGCVDEAGNALPGVLEYDEATHTATVTTNSTAHCYLYFDKN